MRNRKTSAKTSRRHFLKTTLAASALALPDIVPAFVLGKDAPSNKITMGFIGLGNNGSNYLGMFLKHSRMRAVAVCDVSRAEPANEKGHELGREPNQRKVDAFYGGKSCAAYEDFREVLARGDIDAIYIATPDHWHAAISIQAAQTGKDIYCQKPVSLTVREGRAITEEVSRNGVIFQTGTQQRSSHHFRRACELVRNGRIGKLQTIHCDLPGAIVDYSKRAKETETVPVPDGFNFDFWLGPAPAAPYCPARCGPNFRWNFDYSGGRLTDWGGHHLDISQWGLGMDHSGPVEIKNARGTFACGPIYNTAIDFYYECVYANGVTLIVKRREPRGVTFVGTEGKVWVTRGEHSADPKEILDSKIGDDEIRLYKSDDHIANFLDGVITRKECICPAETGHRSITLAHLGNIAMRTGRDLKWDPETETVINDPGATRMLGRPMRSPWTL